MHEGTCPGLVGLARHRTRSCDGLDLVQRNTVLHQLRTQTRINLRVTLGDETAARKIAMPTFLASRSRQQPSKTMLSKPSSVRNESGHVAKQRVSSVRWPSVNPAAD